MVKLAWVRRGVVALVVGAVAVVAVACSFRVPGLPPADGFVFPDGGGLADLSGDGGGTMQDLRPNEMGKLPDDLTMFDMTVVGPVDMTVVPPSCSDGKKNGTETDQDCGGGCPVCGDGKQCLLASDCQSGVCTGGKICAIPTCGDGVKNGSESDVDCGGVSCPKCGKGKRCNTSVDCATNMTCASNVCACTSGTVGADCHFPVSCKELHAAEPTRPTGTATIDLDGPIGPQAPFQVHCLMDNIFANNGGGWTLLTRHVASAGYFTTVTGLDSNAGNPQSQLYSILGKVDSLRGSATYEFLYWNREHDKWVIVQQTSSPLLSVGMCATGFAQIAANYTPQLLCGWTPGPVSWSTITGSGQNWTHAVGQLQPVPSYPLACTYDGNASGPGKCNSIEFYVR